jgi:hypothetical protein
MTRVEVITSVERRRRWGWEEKLRIVAESIERHEVESGFVPVRITPSAVTAAAASAESHIDIRLASGIVISVGRGVEIERLRRVLAALAVQ